ncbi:MAG TPA: two-component regulator propeller domain-containing protein [Parapedobacter sp.]|uniref:hybrid sensor histidine kinase/response regulator transcription factor n=1 Tax=Parapedobacter sp. TaxID=1958893 RepID=UPI002C759513|nr:two-component regulator propeller domain-containing protein [Parapedobacter sp.]HWK57625.1 two-component regulator propeller domain-containing protein [Parapedobacter sp.]
MVTCQANVHALAGARFYMLAILLLLHVAGLGQPMDYSVKFTRIGLHEGLSQSSVFSLCQDYLGFMWVGTRDGLNRYDARTFTTYRNIPSDSTSLTNNYILSISEDSKKRLWVGTSAGINLYNRHLDRFERFPLVNNQSGNSPSEPNISAIKEDRNGRVWFATTQGLYCLDDRINPNQLILVFDATMYNGQGIPLECSNVLSFYEDFLGRVWLGTEKGVLVFDPYQPGTPLHINHHFRRREGQLNSDEVRVIREMADGIFWFGTKDGGVNIYNANTGTFDYLTHQPEANGRSLANNDVRSIIEDRFGGFWIGTINGLNYYTPEQGFQTFRTNDYDQFSLSNNSIRPIFQDKRGSVWIGTYYGGVCVFDRHIPTFQNYSHSPYISSLSYNVVSSILEDRQENLWVGTEGGGLNYMDKSGHVYRHFKHNPDVTGSLSHNHVKSLYLDREENLWVGTYTGGLNFLKKGTHTFQHIRHNPSVSHSISNDNVYSIKEDAHGNLWFGTYGGGLNVKKPGDVMRFESYRIRKTGRYHISSDLVRTVFIDSRDNLWVGTEDGLNLKRPGTDQFEVFRFSLDDPRSISGNVIISIFEDSKGRIWFGTFKNGLNRYHYDTGSFSRVTEQDGLPGNNIFGILEDAGHLWLSTNKGICRFNPESGTIKSYNTKDGIGGNEFSIGAYCRTATGRLIFGGSHGLTVFNPNDFSSSSFVPPILFTDFRLFNKPVSPTKDGVLSKPIFVTDTIVLSHAQRIFTVEFSAINYVLPEKNKYAYRLDGLEDQWNYVNVPSATYTNLHAGTYTLLARGSSNDGIWNEVPAKLTIKILPPLWQTWWAYLSYALLVASGLYVVIRYTKIRSRLEHQLELEHLENERQREINEIKLNFFTSISHEFRTPLTLILAPVQHLLTNMNFDAHARTMMVTVKNNSLRLLNLVNQLLDFRKQENGNFQLAVSPHDFIAFIDRIVNEFHHYAEEQRIHLEYSKPTTTIEAWFDADQFEKVIYNLLSNAFKFAPIGGSVRVTVEKIAPSIDCPEGSAMVTIWDNGKGIPGDKLTSIFEFYYQFHHNSEQHRSNLGSGIGLALAKNLTEMHGGKISVTSYDGKDRPTYTRFTVELPLGNTHYKAKDIMGYHTGETLTMATAIPDLAGNLIADDETVKNHGADILRPVVLVVEDNTDIRTFIANHLRAHYTVLQASNGLDGWALVQSKLPDLVITDIMMPMADGISLLKNIKQHVDTNHIPVLLLTARTSMENVIEGLQLGSDDYITKPFHLDVLSLKIRNSLAARERFRKKFIRDYVLTPQQEVSESDAEQQFLGKVIKLIEDNLVETQFNVNALASELGMSRPVLYRKLKQMTDLSVIELINVLRLKKAAQLLAQGQLSVSEVAYQVGFSDPKYFGKSFKSYFGKSPTAYTALEAKEQQDVLTQKTNSF